MKNISNEDLRREIEISRECGAMTDSYAEMIVDIVKMYYSHRRWGGNSQSIKDLFISDFMIWLMTDRRNGKPGWMTIDSRNPRSVIQRKAGQIALDHIKHDGVVFRHRAEILEIAVAHIKLINRM